MDSDRDGAALGDGETADAPDAANVTDSVDAPDAVAAADARDASTPPDATTMRVERRALPDGRELLLYSFVDEVADRPADAAAYGPTDALAADDE